MQRRRFIALVGAAAWNPKHFWAAADEEFGFKNTS
jgi:hypothetical protein